jgi:hypothetical protein
MKLFVILFFAAILLVGVACHPAPRATTAELRAKHPDWPLTVDDAVTKILAGMSETAKAEVKAKKREELILYHLDWGMGIRNYFGLWNGNESLLADCHTDVPDGASMVIIEAVWLKLQTDTATTPNDALQRTAADR